MRDSACSKFSNLRIGSVDLIRKSSITCIGNDYIKISGLWRQYLLRKLMIYVVTMLLVVIWMDIRSFGQNKWMIKQRICFVDLLSFECCNYLHFKSVHSTRSENKHVETQ